jgi:hypothetical protein
MRIMRAIRMLSALVSVLVMAFNLSPTLAGQQPPHCAQNIFCLFNQEATASDFVRIHKYSEDLIGLIVPPEAGKADTEPLANRLARAEQTARTDKGKLVPEANVVRAFNELMQEVGAPSSLGTDEASIHRFRQHAASIKAFASLFSADRNGANCNPGEAVFLLGLLISDNGVLLEGNLDTAVAMMHWDGQRSGGGVSYGVAGMESMGLNASGLLFSYSSHHSRGATIALFNHVADTLGF